MRKRCFDPVVSPATRVLVLGSLPGDASLARGQYYAHPQNKFWELVGAVLDTDLRALPYEDRLTTLLDHGVGLWDVVAEADRPGSLDAAISRATHNPLASLAASLPALRMIAFNGGTAARLGRKQLGEAAARWQCLDLPSSSPANTLAFARKLERWLLLKEALSD